MGRLSALTWAVGDGEMMRAIGCVVLAIFLVGLLVITGILKLIF